MKAKKLFSLGLITVIGMTLSGGQVLAATADDGTAPTKDTTLDATFTAGTLTIVSAPDTISFGTNPIQGDSYTYYDQSSTSENLVISDLRGNGAGWNVTVTATPFTESSGTTTLKGATIKIPALASPEITSPNSSNTTAPESSAVTITPGETTGVNLLNAQADAGIGVWTMAYPSSAKAAEPTATATTVPSFALVVPVAYAGSFTSTLTWTLNDAPYS